jgi:ATP/maltotriose-dependent transcriptional regulator MalT/DNA-binding SARP family transcriptional activator
VRTHGSARLGKLLPPDTRGLAPRPRLFERLDAARAGRLVWLDAPVGAGKTALVASWVARGDIRAVWYRVDAADGDPATFLHYLALAAGLIEKGRAKPLPPLMPEHLPGLPGYARGYFQALYARLPTPFVLVLDDFQEAPDGSPFQALIAVAVEELPPGGSLLAISRHPPPPALARWTVAAGYTRLAWEDLRLDLDEAAAVAGERVDVQQLSDLHARTRGWIAGLLLSLRAQGTGTTAGPDLGDAGQAVFDYLAGALFDRMEAERRDFLLRTALLPAMTDDAAAAISDQPRAERVLADLHARNCFTERLDRPARVYEYHPLFRAFLLARAERELDPATLAALRGRAAQLCEEQGWLDESAALRIGTSDWDGMMRLIVARAPVLLSEGRLTTLERWILAVPEEARNGNARMAYWHGICRAPLDPAAGRALFASAHGLHLVAGDAEGALLAVAGLLEAYGYRWDDLAGADPWIDELERLLGLLGGIPSQRVEIRVLAGGMGIALRRPDHPVLPVWAERAAALGARVRCPHTRAALTAFAGLVHVMRGDYRGLDILLEVLAPPSAPSSPDLDIARLAFSALANVQAARHEAADALLEQALALAGRSDMHRLDGVIHALASWTRLSAGNPDGAAAALASAGLMAAPEHGLAAALHAALRAGILLGREDLAGAVAAARRSVAGAASSGAVFFRLLFQAQLAQLLVLAGQHAEAGELLAEPLALGRLAGLATLTFPAGLALACSRLDTDAAEAAEASLREALAVGARHELLNWHPCWVPRMASRAFSFAVERGIEPHYARQFIRARGVSPWSPAVENWPWPVRVYTLGRFAVLLDGEPLTFAGKAQKRPLQLLKALIALGGRGVSAGELARAVWEEEGAADARHALDVAISRLRRLLGAEQTVLVSEGKLSLNDRLVWVDACAFERLGQEGEQSGCLAPDRDRAAFERYTGAFLAGEEDAPWLLTRRQRLRGRYARLVGHYGARLEAARDWAGAVAVYLRALEIEPLEEELYRLLMHALLEQGEPAEALMVFRRCRELFSIVLGIAPGARLQALAARAGKGG